MKKIIYFFIFFFFSNNLSFSQEYINPLDFRLLLSGTFGELRGNHFHAGIDFKTKGVEGQKIYAIADGYISRIKVSSYGYGKALYINHPNGQTSPLSHAKMPRQEGMRIEQLRYPNGNPLHHLNRIFLHPLYSLVDHTILQLHRPLISKFYS